MMLLPKWPAKTELIGIGFELTPLRDSTVFAEYSKGLHAWFLDQVRQSDPELSELMHDNQEEKPFTLSGLDGQFISSGRSLQLEAGQTYHWSLSAMNQRLSKWLSRWIKDLPDVVELRQAPLKIKKVRIESPATTYSGLAQTEIPNKPTVPLTFLSPTSFRRKGQHLPLPWPSNVFHSYLRRWNIFSGQPVDQDSFLEWIDDHVLILRHELKSVKVAAGKKGSVTGFTGVVEFGLSSDATENSEFVQLFWVLGKYAPYCGTGHKTTFGLGQTEWGWNRATDTAQPLAQQLHAQRIADLTEQFLSLRKRRGGDRAREVAETWATILTRREFGESLQEIAQDLEMPYGTVKTYAKLARKALSLEVNESLGKKLLKK